MQHEVISVVLLISIFLNIGMAVLLIRRRKSRQDIPEDFKTYQNIKRDLSLLGGGMIEIRRISPDDVFIRS